MKKYPPHLLLIAFLLLAACQKEEEPRWLEVTTESYSGSKVVVDGVASAWADGDELRVNSTCVTIHKSGDRYYIDATEANATGVNRALYPASLSATALTGDAVTITLPTSYRYRTDGTGHQLIELPMAACEAAGERLCFKHLTGAMYFTIENSYGTTLQLDRLSVTSDNYCLSGSRNIDFGDLTSVEPDDEGGEADHTVSLLFDDVSLGDGESLTVIIPVAPVGADNHFTVNVSAHHEGTRYTYSRTQSTGGALARNQLGYATTDIETGENVTTGALFEWEYSYGMYVYHISSPEEFALMVDAINNKWSYLNSNKTFYYYKNNFKITRDIDMTGYTIPPITGFNGENFDGNGHTIHNLTISSNTGYCGLFKTLSAVTISGLTIDGISLQCSGSDNQYCAPLACETSSTSVKYCNISSVSMSISDNGYNKYIGGLIAKSGSSDTISNCNITQSVNISVTNGVIYYGGIVGSATPAGQSVFIRNCNIDVSGTSLSSNSNIFYGGVAGYVTANAEIKYCHWEGTSTSITSGGTIRLGGLIGRITSTTLTLTSCNGEGSFTTEQTNSYFGKCCGQVSIGIGANTFNSCDFSVEVNSVALSSNTGS